MADGGPCRCMATCQVNGLPNIDDENSTGWYTTLSTPLPFRIRRISRSHAHATKTHHKRRRKTLISISHHPSPWACFFPQQRRSQGRLHPPTGRVEGEERAFGEGGRQVARCSHHQPRNPADARCHTHSNQTALPRTTPRTQSFPHPQFEKVTAHSHHKPPDRAANATAPPIHRSGTPRLVLAPQKALHSPAHTIRIEKPCWHKPHGTYVETGGCKDGRNRMHDQRFAQRLLPRPTHPVSHSDGPIDGRPPPTRTSEEQPSDDGTPSAQA